MKQETKQIQERVDFYKTLRIVQSEETGPNGTRYYLQITKGNQRFPYANYVFTNEERRKAYLEDQKSIEKSVQEEKEQRRQERLNFKTTLKKGDILYSSWGYDQTNIDFYQVTEVVGDKTVKIRQICHKSVENQTTYDNVVAIKDAFVERKKETLKRVRPGNIITLTSYSSAFPWDGKPLYETNSMFGH